MGARATFFDDGAPGLWRDMLAHSPCLNASDYQSSWLIEPALILKSAQALRAEGGRSTTPGAAADHSHKEISPFATAAAPGSGSGHATPMPGFPVDNNCRDAGEPFWHTIHGRFE